MKLPEIHIHIHVHEDPRNESAIAQIRTLSELLSCSSSKLKSALGAIPAVALHKSEVSMSLLDDAVAALTQRVNDAVTVEESAIAFINGVPGLIAHAVAEATAAGATPEQLAAITALGDKLTAEAGALSAAVAANTPAAVPPPAPPADNPPPVDPANP